MGGRYTTGALGTCDQAGRQCLQAESKVTTAVVRDKEAQSGVGLRYILSLAGLEPAIFGSEDQRLIH